jgi:hypothetical protein
MTSAPVLFGLLRVQLSFLRKKDRDGRGRERIRGREKETERERERERIEMRERHNRNRDKSHRRSLNWFYLREHIPTQAQRNYWGTS